jgi:serine/threonine-protein kinase RsbT
MQSNIIILSRHTVPVRDESDVYAAVGLGRKMTTEMGFGSGAQACAQTIIAELARNALRHGGGGTVALSALQSPSLGGQETRRGLEVVVQDRGPGIPDVSRALEGGGASPVGVPSKGARPAALSGAGLGVGLSSAQRLADEFTIDTIVGSGTRVRALKWDSPGPADNHSIGAADRRYRAPAPLSRRNK